MVQYALQVFEYEDESEFRTLDIDGQPWFVLADVCRALDLQPNNDSYYRHSERLDADEKRTIPSAWLKRATSPLRGEVTIPGAPRIIVISESGLYSLTLTSKKPEAKRFKKWVTAEVLPSIRRTGGYGGKTPAFIKRYNMNWDRVEQGYFSVISELAIHIWGRLEHVGHIMADRSPDGRTENRPDVSVGLLFSKWLKKNHPDVSDDYKLYRHVTPEWEGDARQYPNSMLPLFRAFVDTVWMPEHFERYFNTRDPAALPYLVKLLPPARSAVSLPAR